MNTNYGCLVPKIVDMGKWESNKIRHYSSLPRIRKQLRRGNWNYIQEHPEVRLLSNKYFSKFNWHCT